MGDNGPRSPRPSGGDDRIAETSGSGEPSGSHDPYSDASPYYHFLMLVETMIQDEDYDSEYLLTEAAMDEVEGDEYEEDRHELLYEESGDLGGECDVRGEASGVESRQIDDDWDFVPAGPTGRENMDDVIAHLVQMRTAASQGSARLGGVREGRNCRVNAYHMLRGREMNVSGISRFSQAECCHLGQRYVPTDGPTVVDRMDSRAYIGQFSNDGSIFVAAYQDRRIRLYNVDNGWSLRKDVIARDLRWTVTDTALSPDQRFLVYSSISPVVHLVNVGSGNGCIESLANVTDIHEGLNFGASTGRVFGLWSLQFSADGREIVAGGNDNLLHVFDLESNKVVLKLRAHSDDVNAVAFAEESSHLLFSGSDDSLCKVWDRRALERQKPAGLLVGHCEGITHLSSKGDGRHLISNSKDQTIKLWDLRKMRDQADYSSLPKVEVPDYRWDYRWMDYPGRGRAYRHPYDCSVMTYKGHQVLETLIRCYFSPLQSTGQRYIYTGSKDGDVYIYDLVSGALVTRLSYHRGVVRDCSWHPYLPMMVSASWDGSLALWEHLRGETPSTTHCRSTIPEWTLSPLEDLFDSD